MDTAPPNNLTGEQSLPLSIYDVTVAEFIPILKAKENTALISAFYDEIAVNGVEDNIKAIESRNVRINRLKMLYNWWLVSGKDYLTEEGIPPEKFEQRIKNEEVNLKIMIAEFGDKKPTVEINEKWFYDTATDISDFKKYHINLSVIKLGEFVKHFKDLIAHIEMVKRKNGN